jgi:hypothetical protein
MPAPIVVGAAKIVGKAVVNETAKRFPGGILGLIAAGVVAALMAGLFLVNAVVGAVGGILAAGSNNSCGGAGTSSPPSTVAGIPQVALDAYRKASLASGVDWAYLAAIGKHESGHGSANGATLGADGVAAPMIKTPPLNGSGFGGNNRPLPYSGEGNIDGWDHGVGPMQFLLSTWYGGKGADGNLDGKKDPNNIFDAALASGLYLRDLGAPGNMDKAIFGYNRSNVYVEKIKASAAEYRAAAASAPTDAADVTQASAPDPVAGGTTGPYSTANLGPSAPQTIALANLLGPMFNVGTVGGYRAGAADHGDGLALDFMVDRATGERLAEYAQANAQRLGIRYIIWWQRIWNIEKAGEGWREMADRGSITQNHKDHVHISLQGTPSAGLTPSGGCGYMPTGVGVGDGNNAWGGFSNGKIAPSALCALSFAPAHQLRCDSAAGLERVNTAYRAAFGTNLSVTDAYRSYADQVSVYAQYGYPRASMPGQSDHGWALAVDLGGGINRFGTPQYNWMKANAPANGWVHPARAEPGGKFPEPWHWVWGG